MDITTYIYTALIVVGLCMAGVAVWAQWGETMKLDEISKLLGEATPGPWEHVKRIEYDTVSHYVCPTDIEVWVAKCGSEKYYSDKDARLIAAAPTIIKELVERVRLLKAALVEIKTGEVEVWDDGEEQIVITNMDEEEMQKIAADALDELAAKESA